MPRILANLPLRSAVLAAGVILASASVATAQTPPAPGGEGQGRGERQRGGEAGRGGDRGGMGNMGRMFGGGRGGMGGMGRGMQDMREALEADFVRRDIPLFVRQLALTEDQSGVLEALYIDYEAAYQPEVESIMGSMGEIGQSMMRSFATPERQEQMRQTWESMRKEMEEAEAANGPMDDEARRAFFRDRMQKATERFAADAQTSGLDAELKASMGAMLEKLEAWQTRKATLRNGFSEGLKAVLDDDQLSNWPAFERFLVREKTLPRGRVSGENVNLFFVVDELRLPPDEFAKIEPFFNDYEMRLDSALRARNGYLEESMPRLFKSMQDGDVDGATRIFKRQADLRGAVRDVNEEFRTQMVTALGETEWAKQLEGAVLRAGWDRIYRATATERMFEEALKLTDLDPTVVQSITDLFAQYRGELSPMNERLRTLARTQEPEQIVREGERFVSAISQGVAGFARNFGGGDAGEDPMRKVFDERNDLGERYQERLRALLTPEQIEKLPRSGRGGRGGGGQVDGEQMRRGIEQMLERIPEEQRKQFMDRVDTNKNGQIDDDEREGLREYMREQFQNMRGGEGGQGGGGGRRGRGGEGGGGGGDA